MDPPASVRVGDKVTVRGVNFRGRAEIRLNGVDGPQLATGSGRQFAVKFVVPKVPSGLNVLVGVGRDAAGGLSGTASAPLEVVSSAQPGRTGPRAPSSGAEGPNSSASSSSGIAVLPAAAGGFVLLVLGALLGMLLDRRRRAGLM